MVVVMSETGHATNMLAADLARENERLTAEVARLTSRVYELEAQLQAMTPPTITLSGQTIDLNSGAILRDDQVVGALSRNETQLLRCLAPGDGRIVTYHEIGQTIWPGFSGLDLLRVIRVNLSRLRAKIDRSPIRYSGSTARSHHIVVVQDVGIRLEVL